MQISWMARGTRFKPPPRKLCWISRRQGPHLPCPSAKVFLLLKGALTPSCPSQPNALKARHAVSAGDEEEEVERGAIPGFKLLYSIRFNPFRAILEFMRNLAGDMVFLVLPSSLSPIPFPASRKRRDERIRRAPRRRCRPCLRLLPTSWR